MKIIEILESESNQQTADDKFNRVDIKAKNDKGEIIIIEIQNTRELYYLERILYGVAKAITEHISLGERYYEVKKIYSISILYFDIGKGDDYLYHGQNNFVGVHTNDRLEVTTKEKDALVHKLPAEIFPEYFLVRVNEFNKVAVTPLEEWVEYLKTGCIRPDTEAPGLKEAREKLVYYNMSKAERQAYDEHLSAIMIQNDVLDGAKLEGRMEGRMEGRLEGRMEGRLEGRLEGRMEGRLEGRLEGRMEGRLEGRLEGRAEGLVEGLAEGRMEVARNMKKLGVPIEIIMQSTGLSEKEIENL